MGYMELSNNSLMVEAPGFIRGVNTKSKILLEDDKVLNQVVLLQGGWRQRKANIPNYPFLFPAITFWQHRGNKHASVAVHLVGWDIDTGDK
jgi:hypothetical protein